MADGFLRRIDEYEWSMDRKFDELEDLLRALATKWGHSIAPVQGRGQVQSCDGVLNGIENQGDHRRFEDNRTLLVKIHLEYYVISSDVLNQVFAGFGELEHIERLGQGSQFQWRIQFRNHDSAFKAFESYNGRCIYDDCCRMELILGCRNNSGLSETEVPMEGTPDIETPIEDANQIEEVKTVDQLEQQVELITKIREENDSVIDSCEVNSDSFESIIPNFTSDKMGGSYDLDEIGLGDFQLNSIELLETSENSVVDKVFDEMPNKGIGVNSNHEVVLFDGRGEKVKTTDNSSQLQDDLLQERNGGSSFEKSEFKEGDTRTQESKGIRVNDLVEPSVVLEESFRSISLIDIAINNSKEISVMGNWVFDPGSTETLNCKCYSQLNGLEGQFECFFVDRFDGLNKQAVEQLNFDVYAEDCDCFKKETGSEMTRPNIPWRKSKEAIWKPGDSSRSSLGMKIGGIEQAVSCQSEEMLLLVRIPDVIALVELLSGFTDSLGLHSGNALGIPVAYKVMVERISYVLLEKESVVMSQAVDSSSIIDVIMNKKRLRAGNLVFDPGVPNMKLSMWSTSVLVWFAKGNLNSVSSLEVELRCTIVFSAFFKSIRSTSLFVFDPGGVPTRVCKIVIFDPGGVFAWFTTGLLGFLFSIC